MVWFNCVYCKTMENFHCLVLRSPSLLIDSVVGIFKGFYFIHRFPGTRCLNHVIQSRTKRKMDGQATFFLHLGMPVLSKMDEFFRKFIHFGKYRRPLDLQHFHVIQPKLDTRANNLKSL